MNFCLKISSVALFGLLAVSKSFAAPLDLPKDRLGVRWGAMPYINYTTERGAIVGASAQRFQYGDGTLSPYDSLLTIKGSWATLGSRELYVAHDQVSVGGTTTRLLTEFLFYTDELHHYFGIGDNTTFQTALRSSNRYYFRYRAASLRFGFRNPLNEKLDLQYGLGANYDFSSAISADTVFAQDFGENPSPLFYPKFHIGLLLDRRDHEITTSSGHYSNAVLSFTPFTFANALPYARVDLDHRRYFSLIPDRWLVLGFQGRYTGVTESAPTMEKARLGSIGTLRGLPLNRILANHSLSLRSELRSVWFRSRVFDLPLKVGSGLFLDLGQAGDTLPRLFTTRTKIAVGVTAFASYFTDDFLGSADFGFSEEGSALYLRLTHAF